MGVGKPKGGPESNQDIRPGMPCEVTNTLLNAVAVTGAGSTVDLGYTCERHSMSITFVDTVDALTVDLEGSVDGVNFTQLYQLVFTAAELVAKVAMVNVFKPARYIRANVITITNPGATFSTTVLCNSGGR